MIKKFILSFILLIGLFNINNVNAFDNLTTIQTGLGFYGDYQGNFVYNDPLVDYNIVARLDRSNIYSPKSYLDVFDNDNNLLHSYYIGNNTAIFPNYNNYFFNNGLFYYKSYGSANLYKYDYINNTFSTVRFSCNLMYNIGNNIYCYNSNDLLKYDLNLNLLDTLIVGTVKHLKINEFIYYVSNNTLYKYDKDFNQINFSPIAYNTSDDSFTRYEFNIKDELLYLKSYYNNGGNIEYLLNTYNIDGVLQNSININNVDYIGFNNFTDSQFKNVYLNSTKGYIVLTDGNIPINVFSKNLVYKGYTAILGQVAFPYFFNHLGFDGSSLYFVSSTGLYQYRLSDMSLINSYTGNINLFPLLPDTIKQNLLISYRPNPLVASFGIYSIFNNDYIEPTDTIPTNCYETNIANYELQKWDLPTVYGTDTWLNYNRENLNGSDLDTFTGSLVYYLPNIGEDSKYLSFQFRNTKNQVRSDILDLGNNDFDIKIPGLFLQSDELINKQSGIYFELKRENIDEFMIDFDGDWEIDLFDGLGRTDYELGLYRLENPLINDLVSGQVYRLDGFKTNKIFVLISRKTFDSTFTINDMYIGYDKLNGATVEVVCSEDDGSYTVGTNTGITQQELDYLENKSTSISGDNNTKYTTEITESFSLFTLIPNILLDGAIIDNSGSCSEMFDEEGNFNYISSYNKIILLEEVKNFNLFNELGFIRPEFKILNVNPFGWFYDMTNGIFTGITKFFTLTISNIFELFGDYLSILIMTPENDADYCFFGETYHLKYIDEYTTWNDGELHTITDKTNLDYIIYFVIGIALITLLLKFK